jgi:peptidoglycan/xylan/chitin deacetylase (PgdA/CDA1 family)
MRRVLAVILALLAAAPAAGQDGRRFAAAAFHDVVDRVEELDGDAVTTARLVAFFDWIRANGWTPVSLEDVAAAGRGERPLPARAMLVTFDDGYRSLYTRVYPLALAYRIPIVAALVGSWLDAPMDATVRYGDRDVPRRNFISWDEAREMARSGLVEFASHSHDLHRGVRANPQGNELPAASARKHDPQAGYETDAQYRARIAADLERSSRLMQRELGRAPRALVWPFGRYTHTANEVARAAGFRFVLTLDPEPGDAARPFEIGRYLPTRDPALGVVVANLSFEDRLPSAQRYACVDPAALWSPDPVEADERLGRAIERVRKLGANAVVIDAFTRGADGRVAGTWFPTSALPLRADYLSRLAWQFQTRAGADAFVRVPAGDLHAALGDAAPAALADLGAHVPFAGVLLDDRLPALAELPAPDVSEAWEVQRARAAVNAARLPEAERRALEAFRVLERARPRARLAIFAPEGALRAAGIADVTFVATTTARGDAERVAAAYTPARPMAKPDSRRAGLWFADAAPPDAVALVATTRAFQVRGGTAVGWCPDDPRGDRPEAAAAAPGVSSATFPLRP